MRGCQRLVTWVCSAACLSALAAVAAAQPTTYRFSDLAGYRSDGCLAEGALPDVDIRPAGLAASTDGSLYFVDESLSERYLRRIGPGGTLATVARLGISDGQLAWHPAGWIVASGGDRLRRVNTTGEVLPAGSPLAYMGPVAVDGSGTVYVARRSVVLKVTPVGDVVTVAGDEDELGLVDGQGPNARFWNINGLAVDRDGNVYVSDGYHATGGFYQPEYAVGNTIRKIAPSGQVTTFAGSPNTWGWRDGAGAEARFKSPGALAVDADGTLFVADLGNKAIRRVTSSGHVSTVAWGVRAEALTFTPDGALHLVHKDTTTISRLRPDGTLERVAGVGAPSSFEDGPGPLARFRRASSLAFDARGRVLLTDSWNGVVRRVDLDGRVRTVAGALYDGPRVARDGVGAHALFHDPKALTVDARDTAFIVDGSAICRLAPDGTVATVAGVADSPGFADGPSATARFGYPVGIAVDRWGSLYVADSGYSVIRKIGPDGMVTTLAGARGHWGHRDGFGDRARFGFMRAMAGDANGTLYIASEHTLRRVSRYGEVTTLAGVDGQPGQSDGRGAAARFTRIEAVGLLPHGDILVADRGWLRRVSVDGEVVTLATAADVTGRTCGAAYGDVAALVADADGSIVVSTGGSLRRGVPTPASAPSVATLTPSRGPDLGHTSLVITGAGFLPATDVTICGVAAQAVEVQGSTRMVAVSPAHAEAICDVRISNAAGTATAAGAFQYLAPVAVTIRSILPGSSGTGTVAAPWGTTIAPANCRVRDGVALNDQGEPCAFTANVGSEVRLVAAPEVGSVFTGWAHPLACSLAGRGPCDLVVDGPVLVVAGFAPAPSARWFAEGARTDAFRTRFVIANESARGAHASVRHLADETPVPSAPGLPAFEESMYLPPWSWRELSEHPTGRAFSTVVSATEPLAIVRSMTWDRRKYGGHADNGAETPSRTWYFAEGTTHHGFQLFYLLANPGNEPAEVEVTWLRPSPLPPMTSTLVLPAGMRTTLWVNQLEAAPRATDVAAIVQVTRGPAIVAERAMYRDGAAAAFAGGHAASGVTAPATEWWFAEGATGAYFDTFLLLANPGGETAEVEAEYALADGRTVTRQHSVAPRSRVTIWVDQEGAELADTAFSTRVRAVNGLPVVAERAMWWPGPTPSAWREAHASAGVTQPGTTWVVAGAESDAGRGLETYVLVASASGEPGRAHVTVRLLDGRVDGKTYRLPAHGRLSIPLSGDFPAADGAMVTITVQSERPDGSTLDAPPIVVESSTYWDADTADGRRRWAAGTCAPATRLR